MTLFQDARVLVFLADYAAPDGGGKLNAIGVAFNLAGVQPGGVTAPQHLAVIVDVPKKYIGVEFPLLIELRRDDTNEVVTIAGPSGAPDSLRIQQLVKAEPIQTPPGAYIPDDVGSRVQFVMNFPAGLPLQGGVSYTWRVELEGQHRPGWDAKFHVVGPPPPPVIGGPSGPGSLPGVQPPFGSTDDSPPPES